MKTIQWFPGHMTKAMRMMEENVRLVDGVILVLDARAAFACVNKKLEKLFENKPVVYAVNKSDLVDKADAARICAAFAAEGKAAAAVCSTDKKNGFAAL